MKKICSIIILLTAMGLYAQDEGGFGIKAGLNYGSNGDISSAGQTVADSPDEKIGYHFGIFTKIDFGILYIRPELSYTVLNSEYDNNVGLEVKKIDLPVLVGIEILGPLHAFVGPSFQYILDTDLENIDLEDVQNEFSIGMQIGVGLNLGKMGVDLRYERGLTQNEADFTNLGNIGTLDTRPDQFILGVSFKF